MEYAELKEKLEYQKGLCEELDKENDELREERKLLEYFRNYLPSESYDRIVEIAEMDKEIGRDR